MKMSRQFIKISVMSVAMTLGVVAVAMSDEKMSAYARHLEAVVVDVKEGKAVSRKQVSDLCYEIYKNVMKENAKADTYTFTVEQTAGEKTFVNEYTRAALTPSTFSVYSDRDGTILAEDTVTISLTNLPEDEYYPFVRFRVMSDDESKTFTEADEIIFTSSDDAGLYFASFDGVRKMGSFLAKQVGTYTVTVSVNGTVRTFTVNVVA